jgi:hypothetical protein
MSRFIKVRYIFLFVITLVPISLAEKAFAGLIMEQVRYQKGNPTKQKGRIYISNNKIKFTGENGQALAILNLDTGEMIQIDNNSKRYTVAKPGDYFKYIQDMTAKMKAEMEKQLAQLPPEQRAQMEEMMKSQGMKLPGDTKPRKLTLKKTDVTEDIAKYKSVKYEVYEDGKLSEEIWISKEISLDKELNMKKMADYMMEIKRMSETAGVGYSNLGEEEKYLKEIYESGFPMRSVDYSFDGNVYIEEVAKVIKADIPNSEFEAPAGYKRVTLQEMLPSE